MPEEEAPKSIKVDYYIELVLRRRWLLIISFCLAMIGGMYVSVTTPRIYSADTLILIEPKSIPDKYVEPLSEVPVEQRVNTITLQVKSRNYLERIIKEAELYAGPEYKNMLIEEKIEAVRRNISVEVTRGRKGTDSFRISFNGKEPEKITKAVSTLASFFIDESIKVMEAEVIGASIFLQEELKVKAERLINVEEALKEYRMKYMGGLPEQLGSNLSMLEGLRKQMEVKQEGLRDEKMRMIQLEAQMAELRRDIENYSPEALAMEEAGMVIKEPENAVKLRQLKEQYAQMAARYTERHPDLAKMKKMVADLEETVAKEEAQKPAESPAPAIKPKTRTDLIADKYKALKEEQFKGVKTQYEESKNAIKILEEDIVKIVKQTVVYQKRVEETPKREQELMTLRRDYDTIKDSYNSLMERKLDADIAVSMERKSKGERFRILDLAKVPQKPVSPDVKKLLMMSVAVGLGLGGGLIFLLDLLDTSLRRPEDIESLLKIPVLATIPNVYYRSVDKIKQRLDQIMSLFFVLIDVMLLGMFAILASKGTEYVMAKLSKYVPFFSNFVN